jgi:chondroitin AC lyase
MDKKLLMHILVLLFFSINGVAQPDFEIIKNRVINELLKASVDDARVQKIIDTENTDGSWPGIHYTDVSRTGYRLGIHLNNMVVLARAYKSSESGFYKSKQVKQSIEKSLAFWVKHDFISDNWWHNQIGTPTSLVNLMLLVGNELPSVLFEKAQPIIKRANLNATGARPSGDRIQIAGILAKNLLFINDRKQFGEVIKVIENEIKFSTGRGLQYDYSFHHRKDRVNNTISYGSGYAAAFAEWAVYVAGTQYAFSAEKTKLLIDYYLDGICKNLVFGKYPDAGVKNRSFSRVGSLHARGTTTLKRLLQVSDYRENELQEILEIREKGIKPALSFARFYWLSDHFVFQRPEFYTSVRMYSIRDCNMEEPYNGEGLFNHHRGDGTNHVYSSGTEYFDIAPVFDYQKIPGATIMQKTELPAPEEIQKKGLTNFVGAVTDGKYGAAAFDFKSPHDPLSAKKSWFFFDKEYVCLGAGISCSTELPVVTTLNQCLLNGNIYVLGEEESKIAKHGESEYKKVNWVLHNRIGYVFPEPENVTIKNSTATGSWFSINKQAGSPREEIQKDVFKIWLNHGKNPFNEKYQYIVVPATTKSELQQNIAKQHIDILANNTKIQAVKNRELNFVEIVFYKRGEIEIGKNIWLNCQVPGIVMVKMEDGKIVEISVADPTEKLKSMEMQFNIPVQKKGENFNAVYDKISGVSFITVNLPQGVYAGKSVTVNLR